MSEFESTTHDDCANAFPFEKLRGRENQRLA